VAHNSDMTDTERLEDLVEEHRYGELHREVSPSGIADAWLRYQRADADSADHPDWWAVSLWHSDAWLEHDEARVRAVVLALVASCETDDDFDVLGAAVMEVLVDDDEDRLRWIEEQASASPAFRRSLANVHTWGSDPDHVAARVERAAGVPLARPPR
jgi:hypothetical protein